MTVHLLTPAPLGPQFVLFFWRYPAVVALDFKGWSLNQQEPSMIFFLLHVQVKHCNLTLTLAAGLVTSLQGDSEETWCSLKSNNEAEMAANIHGNITWSPSTRIRTHPRVVGRTLPCVFNTDNYLRNLLSLDFWWGRLVMWHYLLRHHGFLLRLRNSSPVRLGFLREDVKK